MKTIRINKYSMVALIIFILFFTQIGIGQEISVPIDIQMELIPKILTLNKSFTSNEKETQINVGVFYSSQSRSSVELKQEIFEKFPGDVLQINRLKIKFIPIDISGRNDFKKLIQDNDIHVAYINPIRAFNISRLTQICKTEKVLTFSSTPEYYDQGISIYFDIVNSKPKIFINLDSARQEGAVFSSHLLKISIVSGSL